MNKSTLNDQRKSNQEEKSSLTRLSKIPIVAFSLELSLTVYQKVKSSSEIVGSVLNRAEKVAFFTLDSLKPVANKFETQIHSLDSLGNTCLDKLEQFVPRLVSFQPKNAYANTVNRFLSWKRYANDKVDTVRNFNSNLNKQISTGLQTVDNLVDNYLPGADDESNEEKGSDSGLTSQVFGIFGKVRRRSVMRLQNIQRLVL